MRRLFSILWILLDLDGSDGAICLRFFRIIDAVCGNLLIALSKAILTDAESLRCRIRTHAAADAGLLVNISLHDDSSS